MQIFEAFRALNALNEDIFSLDADGAEKLSNFMQNDDLEDNVQIIDPEAETEDDLQDNYIGKVILDCCVCHSKIYKEKSEVDVDETGELANVGEECPYCFTPDGFKVIGEVVAFGDESDEDEDGDEPEAAEVEDTEEAEITESLNLNESDDSSFLNNYKDKIKSILEVIWPSNLTSSQVTEINQKLNSLRGTPVGNTLNNIVKSLAADTAKAPVEAEEEQVEESLREDAETTVRNNIDSFADMAREFIPDDLSQSQKDNLRRKLNRDTSIKGRTAKAVFDKADELKKPKKEKTEEGLTEGIEDLSMTANGTHVDVSEEENGKVTVTMEPVTADGGETIAPISPEAEAEIMADEEIDSTTEEGTEELGLDMPEEDDSEIDANFDEFDEESMDGLGESYFKRVYENVNSFKTTAVKTSGNSMIIEGLLEFESGNKKNTSFIFEALDATKSGKFRFVGDNKELTEGKKAFMLTGTINNNKLIVESMNYNYKHTDAEGKTARVYGTERIK